MNNNIIDNPNDLIKLSRDELDEILIEKYNNKALLRELLRRTLYNLNEANMLANLYKEKNLEYKNETERVKEELKKIINSNWEN